MFFDTEKKEECYGCEACVQNCRIQAISMKEDTEGFRYPVINRGACIECGMCRAVCPYEHTPIKHVDNKYVFGGYHRNSKTRFESTSGGAFSAIVEAFCEDDYVIFGAVAKGLITYHCFVTDLKDVWKFRKSKYTQSIIGSSYQSAKDFLNQGKNVLFSGTPCQIAGLLSFLKNTDQKNLFTVEVICEGVPSPLYIRKLNHYIEHKYGSSIRDIDYRYTGYSFPQLWKHTFKKLPSVIRKSSQGKWDFEIMRIVLSEKNRVLVKDRWFNPFWSIWLSHLMTRPSCYQCSFTTTGRIADLTLGDLWGVHLYCPELYGGNGGSSLVVCNTEKGRILFKKARENMCGHTLKYEDALKYQSPMRKTIDENPDRTAFMTDLESGMNYQTLVRKWAKKPTRKLLFQKYVWGNRQKVFLWNIKRILKSGRKGKKNA